MITFISIAVNEVIDYIYLKWKYYILKIFQIYVIIYL